jgi:dCTP deaminase
MILTGQEIIDNVEKGKICLSPFDKSSINPNSYDLKLGNFLYVYKERILDIKKQNPVERISIPQEGIVLKKDFFYLGSSNETIGSNYFVPILHAKSGVARLGLFVHITADLIDIGFHGNLTFQLLPTISIKVYPYVRVAQLSFWKTKGKVILYKGKYRNSVGPTPSRSFIDFN